METQQSGLELDAILLALAAGTREQIVVDDAFLPELARSSCSPWRSSSPRQCLDHVVGVVLSAVESMARCVIHRPVAEAASASPVVMISKATVKQPG